MDCKQKNIIISIIRTALIVLWVYAAVSKLTDYPLFISELNKQPFPKWSIPFTAVTVPLTEAVTALLLVFQRTSNTGYGMSFVLMSLFTLYVLLAMTRAFGHIPCPCAGIIGRMPWPAHLLFNISFTVAAGAGCYMQKHSKVLSDVADYSAQNIIRE